MVNAAPTLRLALFSVLLLSGASFAQPAARRFAIPGHGSLSLAIPAEWRVADRSLADPPSINLRMRPPNGDAFDLQITALWLDAAKLAKATPEANRERVQASGKKMLDTAAEKELKVLELQGKETIGHYYALTDRTSKNTGDDYKYVAQGTMLTGEVLTIFTFLHRDPALPEKDLALRMLADATYVSKPSASAPPRLDALQISEVDAGWELAVPASRLVMTIPKGRLQRANNSLVDHPRYFYFAGGGLNVSGWFERAQGFNGIEEFWKNTMAAWNKSLPAPTEVEFKKIGNWDTVAYEIPLPSGSASNIRAHWVQSGTWIDLHVSLASGAPAQESRAKVLAFLQAIQVKEKDK